MSMFTCKLLDGYVLSNADGYSVNSNWIDIHSSPFYSISVAFSAGTALGTLSLQCSNDQSSDEVARGTIGSAAYVPPGVGQAGNGSYPVSAGSPQGTPLDATSIPTATASSPFTSPITFTTSEASYRWVRLVYTSSTNENVTIDAWMHRKAQIG